MLHTFLYEIASMTSFFAFFGLPGHLELLMVVALVSLIFQTWMIVDVATYESNRPDSQLLMWLLLIIFLGPIPALIYCFVRRPHNRRLAGIGHAQQQPPAGDSDKRPPH
ncbi:MAG: hypothetical protein RIC55_07955 [Pirellulaceae bacterium]